MSLDNWAQDAVERLDRLEAERALLDFVDPNDQQSSSAKRLQEINTEIEELYEKLNAYADGLGDEDEGALGEDTAETSETGSSSKASGSKAPAMPKVVPSSTPPPFDRTAVLPKGGLPPGVPSGPASLEPPPLPPKRGSGSSSHKTALLWPVEGGMPDVGGDPDANVDTAVVQRPSADNQNPSADARRARIKARARKLTVQMQVGSDGLPSEAAKPSPPVAPPRAPSLAESGDDEAGFKAPEQSLPHLVDLQAEIAAELDDDEPGDLGADDRQEALRLPLPDLSPEPGREPGEELDEDTQKGSLKLEGDHGTSSYGNPGSTQTGMTLGDPIVKLPEPDVLDFEAGALVAAESLGGDDEQTRVASMPTLDEVGDGLDGLDGLDDERLKLAQELNKLREDLEQKSRARQMAATQAEERAQALEALIKQADQVQQELQRFQSEKAHLEAEVAQLHATYDSEGQKINQTTEALRDMEQRVAREAELLHEIDSVQTRIAGAKSAVNQAKRNAESECKELRDKIESAQDAAERATLEAERKREAAERAEQRAHKAIESVEQEQAALGLREQAMHEEVAGLESSVEELSAERAALEFRLEALRRGEPESAAVAPEGPAAGEARQSPAEGGFPASNPPVPEQPPRGRRGGRRASGRRQGPRFELFARDR